MFNDSAHKFSKRNHKRNFPSFSFQFPNTFRMWFFWFIICFCSTEEKEWPAKANGKKYYLFLKSFYTVLLVIKQSSSLYSTHILCVWKSYMIFFSIEILSFHYFSAIFCLFVCFFVGSSAIFSCIFFFCHHCFAVVELVCALTWWVFGFQDLTLIIFFLFFVLFFLLLCPFTKYLIFKRNCSVIKLSFHCTLGRKSPKI